MVLDAGRKSRDKENSVSNSGGAHAASSSTTTKLLKREVHILKEEVAAWQAETQELRAELTTSRARVAALEQMLDEVSVEAERRAAAARDVAERLEIVAARRLTTQLHAQDLLATVRRGALLKTVVPKKEDLVIVKFKDGVAERTLTPSTPKTEARRRRAVELRAAIDAAVATSKAAFAAAHVAALRPLRLLDEARAKKFAMEASLLAAGVARRAAERVAAELADEADIVGLRGGGGGGDVAVKNIHLVDDDDDVDDNKADPDRCAVCDNAFGPGRLAVVVDCGHATLCETCASVEKDDDGTMETSFCPVCGECRRIVPQPQ